MNRQFISELFDISNIFSDGGFFWGKIIGLPIIGIFIGVGVAGYAYYRACFVSKICQVGGQ
jgi:hypothetical protein